MSILIGALDVDDEANGYHFEFREGGPTDGIATVRGQRVTIPGKKGRYTPTGTFQKDTLPIRLHGWVEGEGATALLRQQSFRTRMQALLTACDDTDRDDVTITVTDLEGLADDETATIDAGFVNFEGPAAHADWREFDIHLEATDPPEWDISSASSSSSP